jgi:hypothetical protein
MAYPVAPTNPIPTVATDATYNAPGDGWDGADTKVAPSVTVETQGFIPAEPIPADFFNWLFSVDSEWLTYLEDYADELKLQKVQGPASSTDNAIARFDGTDGKVVQNSGVRVSDSAEVEYITPPTRTVLVPASVLVTGTDNTMSITATGATMKTDNMKAFFDLGAYVPGGATVTELRVSVTPGAARASNVNRMTLRIEQATGTGATVNQLEVYDDGTTNVQAILSGALSLTLDRTGLRYVVEVEAGDDAATNNDFVRFFTIVFTDPGPRNF